MYAKLFLALLAEPRNEVPDGILIFNAEIVKTLYMQTGYHKCVTLRYRRQQHSGL
jgi:hypothetical protein